MSRLRALFAMLVLLLPAPVLAGSVYVTTANEEIGHAWLFGSRNAESGTCWLAVPRHVALAFDGETLLPLRFRTPSGAWGESGPPVAVAAIPGAAEAAGNEDLAFAPVVAGARPADCLDRLGLPPFAYDAALNRRDPLFVFSMLPTSFGNFAVGITAGRTDASGLRLEAADPADAATYFKRGLSGAVATMTHSSGVQPLAMILRVEDDQQTALALRFDRIRTAFDLVEAAALAGGRAATSADTGLPYDIVSFAGITRGDGPATALAADTACWRVAPEGGQRGISLVIQPAEGALRGLSVVQADGCGAAPVDVVVDQRPNASTGWSLVSRCTTTPAATDIPACRIDLRSARELRVTVLAGDETGISALRLY